MFHFHTLSRLRYLCAASLVPIMVSCGGSDGDDDNTNGGGNTGGDDNTAPALVTLSTINTFEGNAFSYEIGAADAEDDTVTFSIAGGADQAEFAIDSTSGLLSANAVFDYENPTDANSDNQYELTLKATDAHGASSEKNVTIKVEDQNDRHSITSSANITISENTQLSHQIVVEDQDADEVFTYSVSSGNFELFDIDDNGLLTSTETWDFENPNAWVEDGIMELTISVADEIGRVEYQSLAITITDTAEYKPVIVFPSELARLNGTQSSIRVMGKVVSYDGEIEGEVVASPEAVVTVNGITASISEEDDRFWIAEIPVQYGDNTAEVTVTHTDNSQQQTSIQFVNTLSLEQALFFTEGRSADELFVLLRDIPAIAAFDIATGDITPLVSNALSSGPELNYPISMATYHDSVLYFDTDGLYAYDLQMQVRQEISGPNIGTTLDYDKSSLFYQELLVDEVNNVAFFSVTEGIVEVDLLNGTQSWLLQYADTTFDQCRSTALNTLKTQILCLPNNIASTQMVHQIALADATVTDIDISSLGNENPLRFSYRVTTTGTEGNYLIYGSTVPTIINLETLDLSPMTAELDESVFSFYYSEQQNSFFATNSINGQIFKFDESLSSASALNDPVRVGQGETTIQSEGGKVFDKSNNRILSHIDDNGVERITAISLTDGDRTNVVSNEEIPASDYNYNKPIAYDATNNFIYVANWLINKVDGQFRSAISRYSLTDGEMTEVLSGQALADFLEVDNSLTLTMNLFDPEENRILLVVNKNYNEFFIWYDLDDSSLSTIKEIQIDDYYDQLWFTTSADYDRQNNLVLAGSGFSQAGRLSLINVTDGTETIVTQPDDGLEPTLDNVSRPYYDVSHQRALVTTAYPDPTLAWIDLATGERTDIFSNSTGVSNGFGGINFYDNENRIIYSIGGNRVYIVNELTGDTAILSQ